MIQVKCACGKTLSAKPELAGRRVKCPKCAAVLTVPAAPPPAPAADDNPFAFGDGDGLPASKTQRGLFEARRLSKYWRKRNGDTSGAVPGREVARRMPKGLKEFGKPESAFLVGAVPSQVSQYGPFVCGPILLASVCVAAYFLGIEEMREDYLWVGLLAFPVGAAAIAGWVYFARLARVQEDKFALLYEDGVAVVTPEDWWYYRWDEIEEVELKPETRHIAKTIVYGHQFIVKPAEGENLVLGVEYVGGVELGLTVMERAAAAGAACTGYAQLPS